MTHQTWRQVYMVTQIVGVVLLFTFNLLYFIVGIILFFVGAFGYRNESKLIKQEKRLIPCPYCAEKILPEAKVCKHCHKELQNK
jgi:hypothetical protein